MTRPLAFVTCASRGYGKLTAMAFAASGYDIVITARTANEGDAGDDKTGSLETTADEVERRGAAVLPLPADLLDDAEIGVACRLTVEHWGAPDVVVNHICAQQRITSRLLPAMAEGAGGAVLTLGTPELGLAVDLALGAEFNDRAIKDFWIDPTGASAAAVAKVSVWLVANPGSNDYIGKIVKASMLASDLGFVTADQGG